MAEARFTHCFKSQVDFASKGMSVNSRWRPGLSIISSSQGEGGDGSSLSQVPVVLGTLLLGCGFHLAFFLEIHCFPGRELDL